VIETTKHNGPRFVKYLNVMVVLPDTFRGMGEWKELHGDLTVGKRPKVWTKNKNRSSAKGGTPERLRCGIIQEEVSQILQRVSAGAARRILFRCILRR